MRDDRKSNFTRSYERSNKTNHLYSFKREKSTFFETVVDSIYRNTLVQNFELFSRKCRFFDRCCNTWCTKRRKCNRQKEKRKKQWKQVLRISKRRVQLTKSKRRESQRTEPRPSTTAALRWSRRLMTFIAPSQKNQKKFVAIFTEKRIVVHDVELTPSIITNVKNLRFFFFLP